MNRFIYKLGVLCTATVLLGFSLSSHSGQPTPGVPQTAALDRALTGYELIRIAPGEARRQIQTTGEVWLQPFGSNWRERPETRQRNTNPQLGGSETQEYFRTLLRNVPWVGNGAVKPIRTLGFTSCQRSEGTSTVAAHVATTAASYRDFLGDRFRCRCRGSSS